MEIPRLAFEREFSRLTGLVNQADGQPFTSFREGLPSEWEGYKEIVRKDARRRLALNEWRPSDVGTGRILTRVLEAIEFSGNNLVHWPARRGPKGQSHRALLDARSDTASCRNFEQWFIDLFKRRSGEQAAFEHFRELAGDRYDLIAYLFFLKDWNRFMPIAPATFDQALGLLGLDLVTTRHCSWRNYVQYNDALRGVQRLLRTRVDGGARLIDAHSFCWLLIRLTPRKAEERRRHYRALVRNYEAGDKRIEVWRRTEQTMLRRYVLQGRDSGPCCLCRRKFPIEFLVAAHIKPRSKCTQPEKDDRRNVVAMCRFGCDDLFERGYVYVAEGKIRANGSRIENATRPVKRYVTSLLSLGSCEEWPRSRDFFEWHASSECVVKS
ncbi:MAG: HNH endonuclease [Longimicrobiales bacterium]